ncbi:MAG: hypothetical protein CMN74_02340 [Sphingorhabdus sp.]|nr:hypothetical protein [Sphingorhabdus sp.]
MAMDAKERKKMTIRIVAAFVFVLVLGGIAILLFSGEETSAPVDTLGPSDSMVPADPSTVEVNGQGQLIATPSAIVLQAGQTSQVFTVLASGAPIVLTSFDVPPDIQAAVNLTSVDCPAPPQPLPSGSSCSINVTWDGATPLSSFVDITGSVFSGSGTGQAVSVAIPLTAQQGTDISGLPTEGGIADGTPFTPGAPLPATQGLPSQPEPQPAVQSGPPAPSLRQQQRNAYLEARRQGTLAGVNGGQLNPSARSAYASWDNVGAAGRTSSFPTDMTRVITPDKPITAVISVPIDTRNPVTAVAMVDRDVYGNNGRTIVIPRGSKLIGTPGAADTRVGIAWTQLIRPDGTRFVFEGQSGDSMGRGGVPGRVNERLLERYGYSLIPTAVSAAITAGLGGNETSVIGVGGAAQARDAKSIAAEILSQPLNRIAQDIYARKSEIPIQITVPAGTRITVWSLDDLRLKPMGERDTPSANQNRQNGQNGGGNRAPALPTSNGSGNNGYRAPANDGPEGDESLGNYGVGTIDENGNYIAPGSRAPAPSTAPLNRNR